MVYWIEWSVYIDDMLQFLNHYVKGNFSKSEFIPLRQGLLYYCDINGKNIKHLLLVMEDETFLI